jgi:hypothetical protein
MSKSEVQAPKEKTEIQVIADNINSGLLAFEERKAALIQLKKETEGLTITSIDDKQAISQVGVARKKLKSARVEIQKEGKSMRDPLTKISKSISEKEYELIDIIAPIEKDLQAKEDWVESEKKRLADEEAERKQAIIQARIDKLAAYGFAIDIAFITAINEEDFEKILDNARTEYEKELAKKAEEERLEQEKQAQIEKDLADLKTLREKQAEADRIIKERQDELGRQAEALKKQQEEAAKAEELRKSEARVALAQKRKGQLAEMGVIQTIIGHFEIETELIIGKDAFYGYINKSEDEWDGFIESIEPQVAAIKEKIRLKKEQDHKEAEEKRLKDIENARLKGIADEQERLRLAELKKEQDLAISKDKVKYADTLEYLLKTPLHDMRSSQYRSKMRIIRDFIDQFREVEATEA